MSTIKISVLLPVYNAQDYLKEAIDSILNQTYKNFELLLINDGSPDQSESIIRSYSDNRIVYIKNERNLGLIKSLNKGIAQAKGEFIARMDADDISFPRRFEEQMNAFEENKNAVIVASDYIAFDGNSKKYVHNEGRSDELKAILLFSPCFAHPTVMIKNIFAAHQISYDEKYIHAEDYKLWMDLSALGDFSNVNKPLLKYRSHPNQVSALNSKIQKEKSDELRKLYLQKNGFIFGEEDLRIHNLIGSNVFISNMTDLAAIEKWLSVLLIQNQKLKAFGSEEFARVINKFWYDSCGYTNLGLKAYRFYFGSLISKNISIEFSKKMRLLGKCILRRFRN